MTFPLIPERNPETPMFDNEGTIDDNHPGGPFFSGDDAGWCYGLAVTCAGDNEGSGGSPARYDQSPRTNSLALWAEFTYEGASGSMSSWLTWCQSNWGAMYTWLDGLDSGDRSKAKTYCQKELALAQEHKDEGRLS